MMRAVVVLSMLLAGLLLGCGGNGKAGDQPLEIEEQLGFSTSSPGSVERQSRVENAIRDCMRAQGFDYTPVDPQARQQALTGKANMTDEEFLKQFGYGISTLFGRGTKQSDPNDAIRKSLSAADRAAYDRALGGDNPNATFAEALDSGDFSELGGCTKQAGDAAFGGPDVLNAVVGKLDELDQRIVEDQRMVKATEKWSTCMAEKGFRYSESDAIDEDLSKRFAAIVSGARPGVTSAAPGTQYDRAALAALQRDEVQIATADLACEKEHITPVEEVVRPQYERQFRRDNGTLIARVRPVS